MQKSIIRGNLPRFKHMIPILPIRKIITTQVCTREDDLVVRAIEFNMLESPALVETLWDKPFFEAPKVGGVVHPHVDSVGEVLDEGEEEGGCAVEGGFTGSAEGIDQDGDVQGGIVGQGSGNCVDLPELLWILGGGHQFRFLFPDVERGEEDTVLCSEDLVAEGGVELLGRDEHVDIASLQLKARSKDIEFGGQCIDGRMEGLQAGRGSGGGQGGEGTRHGANERAMATPIGGLEGA